MRTYKIVLSLGVLVAVCAFAYISFMYVYTDHMFAPIVPLEIPNTTATAQQDWKNPLTSFVHKVNTPRRAQQKDNKFSGFELDILPYEGKLWVAHDPTEVKRKVTLEDIFSAVKAPGQKTWWLDVKGDLSDQELNDIVQLAAQYHIPTEQLLFEASAGPLAKRIIQKNLRLLLSLPEGFDQDQRNPQTRAQLNANLLALWKEYHPQALAASFGKYAYLRAYFPNIPKAIYYSATQRPSIKKYFMRKHMEKDPSVKIFMMDEYTWINL